MHNPQSIAKTIQIPINASRGKIPQPATKSALDMNFSANASSINPKEIFTSFIQSPDFASDERSDGTAANTTNGSERAMAKPNIPIIGPIIEPETTDSTNNVPIIIAVHENETRTKVNAIKNILANPRDVSAF